MKCPSCKTKIGSEHYKNDPWAKVDKNGEGYFSCPSCDKNLVHRWVFGPSFWLFIIVAAPLLGALAFGVALSISTALGLGESASEFVTFACYAVVAAMLWLYAVRPVEVTTD